MSWETKRLVDVCDFQGGTQPPKSEWSTIQKEGFVRMIQIRDFTQGKDSFIEYVKDSKTLKKCLPDDIMIGRYGASIGKILTGLEGAYNVALVKTVPSIELNKRFFYYYLNTPYFQNFIQNAGSRAAQAGFNKEELKELQIPLPPLPIQKRIAEILDAADTLRRKDQELLKKYDELAQAIFIDMFGDPVKNEKGWEVKTIVQLAKKTRHSIKRGPFGGALKKEIFVNEGYLVYEQFHALNNDFSFGRYYINEEKYNELIAFDVKPNDIIISCSGIYLGKLAIVPKGAKKGIINQALLKLTLDESIYKNEFFVKVFTQENFKEKYFASERGAAIPNFPPMSTFKEFKFICPPIQIQNEYLEIVNNLKQQIEGIKAQQSKSEALFQTLTQKAFIGELVS